MFSEPAIILVLPVILPLLFSILLLSFRKKEGLQHAVQLLGGLLHLLVSGILLFEVAEHEVLVTQIGGWKAPFGITFLADKLSAVVLCTASLVSFSVAAFSVKGIGGMRISFGYYPIYYIMLAGISGILLTGDIFNMYVWIEVMLVSSFVLLALGGKKMQMEGTINYVTMNLLGSFLLLGGVGLLYGIAGTLNLAQLAQVLPGVQQTRLLYLLGVLFFVALGIKTAVFPLYFWLPASYPTPPAPIAAIFGGLLAKVGFYALLRIFTLIFPALQPDFQEIILVVAAFTMLTAVLAAVAHHHFLKILSVHVVSQVGYLVMGLGLFSLASYAGAIFFLIHIIIVKTNLFLIAGLSAKLGGTYNVYKLGGQLKQHPLLALLFLINAFSLAGVPPLSGFWGKFFLIKSAIDEGFFIIAAVGLVTGVLTLISMTKIWKEAFWKKKEEGEQENGEEEDEEEDEEGRTDPIKAGEKWFFYGPLVLLTLFILGLSFRPGFFYSLAYAAAEQISASDSYINAVLK